jgi:hypothetical protein
MAAPTLGWAISSQPRRALSMAKTSNEVKKKTTRFQAFLPLLRIRFELRP